MNYVQHLTSSMGLKLKQAKCKSLSVCAGKSTEVAYTLNGNELGSILRDPFHKFLGGYFTFRCSGVSIFDCVKEKISKGLSNIDSLLIRDELKVRIYSEYFLGANRFLFSMHDLNLSQIKVLDDLSHCYLKKWLGMPQSGSWCLIHDRHGLDIKSMAHL